MTSIKLNVVKYRIMILCNVFAGSKHYFIVIWIIDKIERRIYVLLQMSYFYCINVRNGFIDNLHATFIQRNYVYLVLSHSKTQRNNRGKYGMFHIITNIKIKITHLTWTDTTLLTNHKHQLIVLKYFLPLLYVGCISYIICRLKHLMCHQFLYKLHNLMHSYTLHSLL